MVSTRQMTIGNNGIVEGNQSPSEGPARYTRNSSIATTSGIVQSCKTPHVQSVFLLNLPQEVIEKILSYLPFKNICHLRLVSRTMDHICSQVLNSTFLKLQNQMLARFQEIKAKMPRRESARRSHHLACESDIIETLHMRLTLLQMSFGKHIERKHICFFPGEILDEVHHILYYIKVTPKLDLPYKVTDELFDLSTMAMEYFKEKIEPFLPDIAYFSTDFLNFSGSFANSSTLTSDVSKDSGHASTDEIESGEDAVEHIPQSNMVLRKRIRKIKQGMKRYNSQLSLLRQDLRSCKKKTSDQQKQISEQQKLLADQQKQTLEYATRLDEYDKKNEEISRKFSTLLQELNKCKTELQYWRCRSPASPPFCQTCGIAIPPQSDELQALINQGVHPEGLGAELLVEPSSPPAVAGSLSPGRPAEVAAAVSAADPKHSERTTEAEKSTNEPGPSSSEPVAAAVNKGKRKSEGGAAPVASPLKDDPPKKKKKKTGRFVQIRAKRIARL